jgi:PAS domain S-box-containing protein
MGSPSVVAKLARWAKQAGEKTFHLHRLNIGPRLTLCFVFIILAMLVGNAVLLWQFRLVRAQAERLSGVDQELIAALQVHTNLMSFYERLDVLAHSEDTAALAREVEALHYALLEDNQRSRNALSRLPPGVQLDPTLLPTLEAIQGALPEQLEAITALAKSSDWEAVRLRLANEVRPLESRTSALVQNVDKEVGEERAQAMLNIRQAQRRILLIVPVTAGLSLLIAAFLGLVIRRSITKPLGRLMEGSEALARGEFQHRVPVIGTDELAHLGQAFNDTAGKLRDLYATLQKSEDRLRLVIDTIPAHVWSAQPDGSVDFISQRWMESTGLAVEDGLGWNWRSLVHPDDLARFVDEWHQALAAGEPMETEARLRQADGEYRWWLIRNVPLRDERGNIVKWYGTSVDIEDRKRAEERVRRNERELRQLTEVIPQHVLVSEPDGTLVYVNQVALEYTGLTLDVALSKESLAKIFHPDDLERVLGARRRAISLQVEWEVEARVRRKDGKYRWFLIRFNPLRDEQGRIFRWYGTRTDIEDRKQAEDALHQARAELAHVTRVATVGEMTASIAHEVNQPIAAVVTNAGACLRWLAAQPPEMEEARQALGRIVKDGNRAGEVIARIRALVEKSPPRKDRLNINETILEVVFLTTSEVNENRISVQTELSNDLPLILGDRIQLQQVILNLIKNAVEAMSAVGDGPRELLVSSRKDESKGVLVAVRDTGPGLDPEALAHLFDPFYTTKPEGMGMGLAISRSIIEAHGGRLWATANEPHGAVFQFTLPADGERML